MTGETMNLAECGLKEQKRYVDINPAIEFLEGYDNSWGQEFADGVRTALHFIKKLPAVNVQEVKHARWIPNTEDWCKCSNCGQYELAYDRPYMSNYCPNCGAKMDGKE